MLRIDDGRPTPLGATWDGRGVNFAVFSAHATAIDICLFDQTGRKETRRIRMPARTEDVYHCYVTGIHPGNCTACELTDPTSPSMATGLIPTSC